MNVVDTSLWIEHFMGNLKNLQIKNAITDKKKLIVPTICIYELYKKSLLEHGIERAEILAHLMENRTNVAPLDSEIAMLAAKLGKEHKLPLADSIIYATAVKHNAVVWTQDKHFDGLDFVKYFPKN